MDSAYFDMIYRQIRKLTISRDAPMTDDYGNWTPESLTKGLSDKITSSAAAISTLEPEYFRVFCQQCVSRLCVSIAGRLRQNGARKKVSLFGMLFGNRSAISIYANVIS